MNEIKYLLADFLDDFNRVDVNKKNSNDSINFITRY